jgi:hypothetical protein
LIGFKEKGYFINEKRNYEVDAILMLPNGKLRVALTKKRR